ncbi:family transcriptional regulator [Leptolyngbya sp. Heron Island J]|uniref:TetR/AcrR family transcriptional regulator n=1 Tax=Leptolyngbya sp. Heron Island J TaxID=1385935 RepID=UPI0003B9E394|nr:TetR/AcrR family transcriptional regulator [Leptolyngbya sp. Heron Island J]ESA34904.1 family transcriptional regulator [Leptolyngbya sp. Heron Island J]
MPRGGAKAERGRPRSVESKQAILMAAWNLLQHCSVRKLSIEAIAREAGVGKTTIYRWWPSKAAVVIDAFLAQVEACLPFPETKTAAESLALQMQQVVKIMGGDVGRIVTQIIAEGQCDSKALESFCDRFLNPRRAAARQVILQGIKSGEFAPDLDPELAMDILYGPIYYRLLVKHLPLDETFAAALSQQAIASILNPKHCR